MQTKVAFIVPYFGRFPSNFQLWLNSCAWNSDFYWLVFTDDRTCYNYPKNVSITYLTFEEMQKILQSRFDFAIDLSSSYKLCDFKPAYGEIFSNWLSEFDFWGYCDIDLVWGDLEKWINDTSLATVDRVSEWGHCSLFRNNKRINSLYRNSVEGVVDYRKVFSSDCNYLFDEAGGCQKIFSSSSISTLSIPIYDVKADEKLFMPTCATTPFVEGTCKNIVFEISDGHVYMVCSENGSVKRQEFAYVHMAKREMNIEIDNECSSYLLVPNKYITSKKLTLERLKALQPKYSWYPQYKWKGIKGKIKVLLGKNKVKWPNSRLQRISDIIHGKRYEKK